MRKIKTKDFVIVLLGKDKGKRGEVLKLLKKNRCLVSGVNMMTKHIKPNAQKQTLGRKEKREGPIHLSNVAIFNEKTKKADRIGFRYEETESGERVKVRYFKSTKETVIEIEPVKT